MLVSDKESIKKNEEKTPPEVITKHTIDNITYTIKSRSSESATQTLQDKLEASIARDIRKIT